MVIIKIKRVLLSSTCCRTKSETPFSTCIVESHDGFSYMLVKKNEEEKQREKTLCPE